MSTSTNKIKIALDQHRAGQLTRAEELYRQILDETPDHPDALHLLGSLKQQTGQHDEAIKLINRAIEVQPGTAVFHKNLASILDELGRLTEAEAAYRQLLEIEPQSAEAHNNLGTVLKFRGQLAAAVDCFQQAIAFNPDFFQAYSNLANTLRSQGSIDRAIATYQRALQIEPNNEVVHSNLLYVQNYQPGMTLEKLARDHAEWNKQHAALFQQNWKPFDTLHTSGKSLRLGFVSPDFRRHPVGYLLIRCLEALKNHHCQIVCYSDCPKKDDLTQRISLTADCWSDIHGMSDETLCEKIRSDRIDILFDLAGHTSDNRLLVFARKPASVQISWLGYVGTTGLAAMDYILADRFQIPAGVEQHYSERIIRLPNGYACVDPAVDAPDIVSLPALSNGHITFGSFNNPAKINEQVVALWSQVLNRVPNSRLVLKYSGYDDPTTRQHYIGLFAAQGITDDRLELLGRSNRVELMATYNRIDIALDPFPYSGGMTTCDALWMGVPIITCPGETFASRHSLSHLSNAGLTATIARNHEHYVQLAIEWANDLPRLTLLRRELRTRMAQSPLCDADQFAADFRHALQNVWQQQTATAETS